MLPTLQLWELARSHWTRQSCRRQEIFGATALRRTAAAFTPQSRRRVSEKWDHDWFNFTHLTSFVSLSTLLLRCSSRLSLSLSLLVTATTTSLTWTSAVLTGGNAVGVTPTAITFIVTASNAIAISDTISITASQGLWAAADGTSVTCTVNGAATVAAPNGAVTDSVSASPADRIVITHAAAIAEGTVITYVCTGGLGANVATTTPVVTFSAVSTGDTTAITGQVGFTLTGTLGWTSATPSSLQATHVPTNIVFVVTPSQAFASGEDFIFTADAAIWAVR